MQQSCSNVFEKFGCCFGGFLFQKDLCKIFGWSAVSYEYEIEKCTETNCAVIYIYHDHPLSTAMAFHNHSNSHSQSYHSLDGATILSWAHDPDCQHTIACDTIEEGSLNH